jgi:hypothetical protein
LNVVVQVHLAAASAAQADTPVNASAAPSAHLFSAIGTAFPPVRLARRDRCALLFAGA